MGFGGLSVFVGLGGRRVGSGGGFVARGGGFVGCGGLVGCRGGLVGGIGVRVAGGLFVGGTEVLVDPGGRTVEVWSV